MLNSACGRFSLCSKSSLKSLHRPESVRHRAAALPPNPAPTPRSPQGDLMGLHERWPTIPSACFAFFFFRFFFPSFSPSHLYIISRVICWHAEVSQEVKSWALTARRLHYSLPLPQSLTLLPPDVRLTLTEPERVKYLKQWCSAAPAVPLLGSPWTLRRISLAVFPPRPFETSWQALAAASEAAHFFYFL